MSIENEDIVPVSLEDEMKKSYLDYAMSVIVSRALPDVRDGMKPIHRRIIYSMTECGNDYNKPPKKSARIVGDVMGKYHPHGDSSVYEAMVRLAQTFSMREILVRGQGNFGSIDGDPPAASRYTEARLSKIAHTLTEDLYSDTVDFQPNFDGELKEPVLLPARFPNILVNGAGGIAVGMATNIPTHNLGEVLDACILLLDKPESTLEDVMQVLPGPDFPTGGIIVGLGGILNAYKTGRGSIIMRARAKFENIKKDRQAIVVTEIPYQVNKARLVEKIAEVVNEKIVEGISDLRDESDKDGIRIVIELKKDANGDVVLNQLYKNTQLQSSFPVNMLALLNGQPKLMNLMEVLSTFVEFREEVVVRRTRFELNKARDRAHILIGLVIAVENIDEVIRIIKTSTDPAEAKRILVSIDWPAENIEPLIRLVDDPNSIYLDGKCRLTDVQAQAILDLKLHRLTGLEREKIANDLGQLSEEIKRLFGILGSRDRIREIIREELLKLKEEFANPRLTSIEQTEIELEDEDFIQKEDVVVTVSHHGYIKRVPLTTYRAQRRGGKGKTGMTTKDEDFVRDIFVANTHTSVLFFSTSGIVYQTKVYKIPVAAPQSKGKALINIIPLKTNESLSTIMALPEDETTWNDYDVVFATSQGTIRRNKLEDFINIKSSGKIAMKLDEGEELIAVALCAKGNDVLISSKFGKCVRFSVDELRVFNSRTSTGVRAIKLSEGDKVISMAVLNNGTSTAEEREEYVKYSNWLRRNSEEMLSEEQQTEPPEKYEEMKQNEQILMTITENGYAKRTSSYEYRTSGRGVKGVKNIELGSRNGNVVSVFPVNENDDVMLITDSGKLIRCSVDSVRITGRTTQGVILFRIDKDEKVVSTVRLIDSKIEDN